MVRRSACGGGMDITRTYLANRFGVKERTISEWVKIGVLPAAIRRGRHATYPPETPQLLQEYLYQREHFYATRAELAERRQLTGQLLPPVLDRGPV